VLTGSQNLLLGEKISQSLAGRVGILQLLPLSLGELEKSGLASKSFQEQIFKGFYPGLYDHERDVNIYYQNYFSTYIQRDVRSVKNLGDLSTFTRLVQLLAGRVGQILNLSELGGQLGVNYKTVESWISVLEASYIVYRLEPFYTNFNKRIIKSPKVYFYDTGLAANLLRINSVNDLENHFALGNLYENMVVMDILKQKYNSLSTTGLYYFRDSVGLEVDVIIDKGPELIAVEIKSSQTFNSDFLKNLNKFRGFAGNTKSVLVYSGVGGQEVQKTKLINYRQSGGLLESLDEIS
jgi:predicted AAA+ superfamily ATPase